MVIFQFFLISTIALGVYVKVNEKIKEKFLFFFIIFSLFLWDVVSLVQAHVALLWAPYGQPCPTNVPNSLGWVHCTYPIFKKLLNESVLRKKKFPLQNMLFAIFRPFAVIFCHFYPFFY